MVDYWLKDYIDDVIERAEKAQEEKDSEYRDGMMLAYNTVLSALKNRLLSRDPDAIEEYGLNFDIDKKYL